MSHTFDDDIVRAVLSHMNDDHTDDNLLIVRAFSGLDLVSEATMTDFDGAGGTWQATTAEGDTQDVRVAWPDGEITERRQVRQQIVALYDAACARLGLEPRPHD